MREITGKITGENGGFYRIDCDGELFLCRARGKFRHNDVSPNVGDNVKLLVDERDQSVIAEIKDRKNSLIRPKMSNLDLLFIIIPAARPAPDILTVDKLSSIAVHQGIRVAVIISKASLDEERAKELGKIYQGIFDTFVTDSLSGLGTEELSDYIRNNLNGKTAAFSGASGVGKSTLLNKLFPELSQETGDISLRAERGKNTTRKVELFKEYGGYIADTPGFTMIDFENFDFFDKDDLPYNFPEFKDFLGKCRYTKCSHTKEDGCAIIQAVKDGIIPESRHKSFVSIYEVLKNKNMWDK
ncbi:MAG: ribosome small subunit-dependent GTPase A [Clostridia bacterium]|nr:ribosome small subunit-dependent GTPase A [Clostridia bacterium]